MDKHSSLLRALVNYGRKKFCYRWQADHQLAFQVLRRRRGHLPALPPIFPTERLQGKKNGSTSLGRKTFDR